MRLLLSTAIALIFATSAHAQFQNQVRAPQAVENLAAEAAPPQPAAPISFGPAQCVLRAFTAAQGWEPYNQPRYFADVNGDNRDDIVGFAPDGVWVSLSTGTGFQDPARWTAEFGESMGWQEDFHERILADVNGDSRADIVGFGNEGTYVALSSGSAFGATARWLDDLGSQQGWFRLGHTTVPEGSSDALISNHHIRMAADVNGDGRADVVGFGNTGTYFATATPLATRFSQTRLALADLGYEQGWRTYLDSFSGSGARPIPSRRIRTMADVNGDRRADIVAFGEDGVYVALASGIRFGPLERKLTVFDENDGWHGALFRALADVNGDGRADIVGIERGGAAVAFGNPQGGFDLANMIFINGMGTATGWATNVSHPRMLVDLNGDNRADFVGFGNDGVWTALSQGIAPMTAPVLSVAGFGWSDPQWHIPNSRFTPDLNADNRADFAGFGSECVWTALSPAGNPIAVGPGTVLENGQN